MNAVTEQQSLVTHPLWIRITIANGKPFCFFLSWTKIIMFGMQFIELNVVKDTVFNQLEMKNNFLMKLYKVSLSNEYGILTCYIIVGLFLNHKPQNFGGIDDGTKWDAYYIHVRVGIETFACTDAVTLHTLALRLMSVTVAWSQRPCA